MLFDIKHINNTASYTEIKQSPEKINLLGYLRNNKYPRFLYLIAEKNLSGIRMRVGKAKHEVE